MAGELLLPPPTVPRAPSWGGRRNRGGGESHDQVLGRAADARLAVAGRSRHRVGHLGLHAALPGHRHGRRRRLVGDARLFEVTVRGPGRRMGRRGGGASPLRLVAVLALALVGASPAGAQERADAGVYRRPLGHDPQTLDPARISDVYSRSVSQQIFDGLVQFDQTLTTVPALAEFWRASRDGLTWTFQLRKGVKFHHGREVTADDVVFSFTRILDPRTRSGAADLFSPVKGAREYREGRARTVAGLAALDRHTVQVTLTEALAPFAAVLAVGHAKIVPREIVEKLGEAFG
ncbi:MAG: hypothetical protein HYU26_06025, partial [Candidatus Rokubacteria bacterium]|nr:hypothetical protein [Candidatus Rokubacteria bacterium]